MQTNSGEKSAQSVREQSRPNLGSEAEKALVGL